MVSTHETATQLGFEAKLWQNADALRNNMDAAAYKHVVLGLIFVKFIADAFEGKHAELVADRAAGADEYRATRILWVPREVGWSHRRARALQPTNGEAAQSLHRSQGGSLPQCSDARRAR